MAGVPLFARDRLCAAEDRSAEAPLARATLPLVDDTVMRNQADWGGD